MKKMLGMFAPALGAVVGSLIGIAPAKAQSGAVVLLLDRSGSMATNGQCRDMTIDRKWVCAVKDAKQWMIDTDPTQQRNYFVWQFRTMGGDPEITVREGPLSFAAANARLDTAPGQLEGPLFDDAATPLAGAYCDAVKFLNDYRASINRPTLPLDIKLESDGLENRTPTDHRCFGPTGGSENFVVHDPVVVTLLPAPGNADGLVLNSWESRMYDAAHSGNAQCTDPLDLTNCYKSPLNPAAFKKVGVGFTLSRVITNVTFLKEFIEEAPLAFSAQLQQQQSVGVDGPPEAIAARIAGPSALAALASPFDPFLVFLKGLAESSGGRLIAYGDGVPSVPGDPTAVSLQPGDVNDNGCVDSADFTLLKQFFGQFVALNSNSAPADLNADGIVDSKDLFVLQNNFGTGCATPPGPFPVLPQSLFSFEDAGEWSSPQAALANTAINFTNGAFGLTVGGANWREVTSIAFPTSSFQGVTSKIAFDIFVPPNPVNRFWLGQTLLFVSCPSAGLFNVPLGSFELTGRPLNAFSTAQFNVPTNVRNVMRSARSDFSIRVVVNSNDTNQVLDNLRFVP